ncbi:MULTISPECIES: NAD(P)H-dependent oxidoreductase subunit E [Corynebacterium]|uniref:NAD(P)H-dependent oxidoreductase subunit E n=2 Tax=Corynebacterium glucuronolyticum TaxID=39791 RepID=A0AAX1L5K4_9CORY|nr:MULTISPECIES: NAD(P)H-dependent oxidoreductase subunit E [Corynebacterium]EEI26677.1 putative NADH dehydrogenase subunit E [Corynebacterium glucuronolyticum ATCC 51867]EEI62869.1 putative NADH dehydrogenase subunit E [Corynebacterium glucuronolyticum ATCC 51866]MCT1443405.1 NAD(P)H-dependent oxidoreductase subunit E [Corynebacterium glucuronolyticum]MCT1564432.1 NAD(P)H-dependent oxidoreductase subunit E [Corynebacterium glucuronolyticum]OFO43459.1 NADH-quinone oxidoreductase subunit E [Cor
MTDHTPHQHFEAHFGDDDRVDLADTTTNLTDADVADLKELAGRYPNPQSALLPMLHLVQSVDGKVSGEGVRRIASLLHMTEAQVIGVATFYSMYHTHEVGKHLVGVCTSALCATMGGDIIYDAVKRHLELDGEEDTTSDGMFTLERIECNAACDFAPILMLNWEYMDNMTPKKAIEILDKLRDGQEVSSTRGPKITSWRDNERVLAGFYDGRADEGPGAGPASLRGLELADGYTYDKTVGGADRD